MIVDAVIEIPMGCKNKYEIDKKNPGRIRLDRVLYSSSSYPAEYGFVENTLADDGDALDILILSSFPTFPGCIVRARVLGHLDILDNGLKDEKVIAVPVDDPRFNHIQVFEDLPEHTKLEIVDFFKTYKALQNIKVEIGEYKFLAETKALIKKYKEAYKKKK